MFKTKYRIVTDTFGGYEAQFRLWWSPFWCQCNGCNTHSTIESAEKMIEVCRTYHSPKVVKYIN